LQNVLRRSTEAIFQVSIWSFGHLICNALLEKTFVKN